MSGFLKKYYLVLDDLERHWRCRGLEIERFFGEAMIWAIAVGGVVFGVAAVIIGFLTILIKDDDNV